MSVQATIQAAWNGIAPGYDEHVTPTNMALAEGALRRAGLRRGMRVLDVAAGSGALSIPAARAGADVLATDISPAMIERLEARARSEGHAGLDARVMDGHELDLDDDTFDIAASQFGVMLFPDLPRGLREMARVVKPGGRVLLVTLGPPGTVEFLGYFVEAVETVVPRAEGLPMDPPPLPFQVSDPVTLRERLADAGLREVHVETVNHRLEFASGTGMWDWVTASNPIGADMVSDLTSEERAAVKSKLDDALRDRAEGGGPAVLENAVNVGIGIT